MYGREGEAIARYQKQRTGEQWSMPDDCDLCKAKLQPTELAPQTLHWRTKPQKVSTEHKLFVTVETHRYFQQSGTYFLCEKCRKQLRPPLKEQLPFVLAAGAVAVPFGILMGGELPLPLKLVFPGLVLGAALLWQMRSRFRGYPANTGFRLHSTTFDGPEQRLIMPVFILLFLSLMLLGILAGGNGVPVDLALGRADGPGGTGTIRMADIQKSLDALYKVAPEGRRSGEMVLKGWLLHKQRNDHFYPTTPPFIQAITEVLQSSTPKPSTQEAVDQIAAETAGKRLVRLQGSGEALQLDVKASRVASITKTTTYQVIEAVEALALLMKQTAKPVKPGAVLEVMDQLAGQKPTIPLEELKEATQAELFAHPEQYR